MGRRKSKKRVVKQATLSVAKVFDCPFCNHTRTVECKMNRQKKHAFIECRICEVKHQTDITHLSEPIDVYSDWIDECAKANEMRMKQLEQEDPDGYDDGSMSPRLDEDDTFHDRRARSDRRRDRYDSSDDEDYSPHTSTSNDNRRSSRKRRRSDLDSDEEEAGDEEANHSDEDYDYTDGNDEAGHSRKKRRKNEHGAHDSEDDDEEEETEVRAIFGSDSEEEEDDITDPSIKLEPDSPKQEENSTSISTDSVSSNPITNQQTETSSSSASSSVIKKEQSGEFDLSVDDE